MLLLGILMLIVGSVPGALTDAGIPASQIGFVIGLGVVMMIIGVVVGVFGIFALTGKFWAVIGLAVVGGLCGIAGILSIIGGEATSLVGLIWVGLSVGLLLAPGSRAWYQSKR
ncbi:MAG: hypothetical protein ACK5H2_04435 [Beutenbergiaceae bacterium]